MKKSKCERPVWQIVLSGVLSALVVLLLLSAIAAMLVLNGVLPVKSIPAAAAVLAAVGAFCGALLTAKQLPGKKLLGAGLCCAGYVCLLLIGNLALVETPPVGFAVIALPCAGASFVAALLASRKKGRSHAGRRR